MTREVLAAFDDRGVVVYQAFAPPIAEEACRLGTFGRGFGLDRMTWIKPSFGWMLYRSGYATKHRQERVLAITLAHEGFQAILAQGIPTHPDATPGRYASDSEWRRALDASDVRYQWDPDRDLYLHRLERRALQVGIRGATVRRYVEGWIVGLRDVTDLAHAVREACRGRAGLPPVPDERPYPLSSELRAILGMAGAPDAPAAAPDATPGSPP